MAAGWPWWPPERGQPNNGDAWNEFYCLKEAWEISEEYRKGVPTCQFCGLLKRQHYKISQGINQQHYICRNAMWQEAKDG
jgi:hypothetical protein